MPKKLVKAFVSHRCKEFDERRWRSNFEEFLLTHKIEAKYGCLLDSDYRGSISSNIESSMRKCDMYIAVITKSWELAEEEGWPKREWELWRALNAGSGDAEKRTRSIGFLLDIPRENVEFISDLTSYKVTNS